ncbi:restriction endonuclease subunit S [Candidatus Aalborgicola defluviihabitans]|uniref:restriction endonuclease subunit S n=2 Tax=Candidatus Aalborgicola defluviihabitans TaxID=3386187 RepID=UPI001D861B81|nr:restriction endonuclease subunit S [Burkholderiales bacterium]
MNAGVWAGYKQTDVGVIPEDWGVAPMGELASIERGKFSARPRNDPRLYGGNIPFIQTGDVARSNGSITTFTQSLNSEGLKVSRLFPIETLFFTIAANIGDVGIAQFEAACPDSLVAIAPYSQTDKFWLLYELSSRKTDFENLASPGAQLNINLEKLRPYLLPAPPLPEQRAIATALSDVDALLSGLDSLIVKKQNLKQAAMQQLLTGQTRLPGFSGEWEVKTMKSLGQTYGGLTGKTKEDFGHGSSKYIPFMNVMKDTVIDPDWLETVDVAPSEAQNLAKKGDLFFNGSSETPEEVGFCSVLRGNTRLVSEQLQLRV